MTEWRVNAYAADVDEPFSDPARSAENARVDALLAGILAEAAAAADAADDEEIYELERAGRAGRRMLDRLRGTDVVRVEISGADPVDGRVVAVGRDVVVMASDTADWAIALWGIVGVVGLSETAPAVQSTLDRLGLASVARSWARDRCVVRLHRLHAPPLDGTIDAVGADHVDLAEHDPGEPRRSGAVRRIVTVPLGAVVALRRW